MIGRKMTNEFIVSEPKNKADAAVIWLHGLGADNRDFTGIVDSLGLPTSHGVRFIFPNAPQRAITVNYGMRMRAWYDIIDLNMVRKEDEVGIQESQQILLDLVQREMDQGISSKRIFLGGFSQGAAMALYTGLRCKEKLAGIIGLSGYLPFLDIANETFAAANRDTPIFMAHGMFDTVVPLQLGKSSAQALIDGNYNVTWNTYSIAHTVIPEEIDHVGAFIRGCLGDD